MREEELDIFNEEGRHIGIDKRSEVHRLGLWHQTFHCWIYQVAGEQVGLLFQKRHPQKDTCPNLLDITSAGHLLASEQPSDGVRELAEELGLSVSFDELHKIGIIRDVASAPGIIDKELCHTYAIQVDQPLSAYRIQVEEVTGLLWVSLDEVEKLFAGELDEIEATGFLLDQSEHPNDTQLMVTKADFVPHEAHYYEQVFTAVRKLAGV